MTNRPAPRPPSHRPGAAAVVAAAFAFAVAVAATACLSGCIGRIQHPRCKLDFDACANQCEAQCEREGAAHDDPYTGDKARSGGVHELSLDCASCVGACRGQAGACDEAEVDRAARAAGEGPIPEER